MAGTVPRTDSLSELTSQRCISLLKRTGRRPQNKAHASKTLAFGAATNYQPKPATKASKMACVQLQTPQSLLLAHPPLIQAKNVLSALFLS